MIGGFCSVFEGEREVRGRGGDAQFIAGGVADAEGGVEFAGWRSEVMVCPPGDCSCEHQRDHDGDDRESVATLGGATVISFWPGMLPPLVVAMTETV